MGLFTRLFERAIVRNLPAAVAKAGIPTSDKILLQLYPDVFGGGSTKLNINNAYRTIAILYACIRARAKNIAQCPLRLYNWKTGDVIEDGFWPDLLEKPSAIYDYRSFIEGISSWLNLKGNFFIEKSDEKYKGAPMSLHLRSATFIQAWITDRGEWLGYKYDDGKIKRNIPRENIIHGRYFNPYDQVMGLSPLDAAKMTLETEFYSMRYNARFFEGDARPPMTYTIPPGTSERDIEAFKLAVKSEREGIENTHKAQVLRGGITSQIQAITQKDMDFLNQRKFTQDEVCMIVGVPKTVVSIYENVNYATALSQDRQFWTTQLIPEQKLIEETLNRHLFYQFGIYCEFDRSGIEALSKLNAEKIDQFVKLFDTGEFTSNELIDKLGLPFDPREWGDRTKERPAPVAPPPANEPKKDEPKEEPAAGAPSEDAKSYVDPAEIAKAARGAIWKRLRKGVSHIESACAEKVSAYFFSCGKKLLKLVGKADIGDEAVTKAREAGETVKMFIDPEEVDDIFDDDKLTEIVDSYCRQAAGVGGRSIADAAFNPGSPEAVEALAKRISKVTVSNETARARVMETIQDVIKQRLEGGLGEEEAIKLLRDGLKNDINALKSNAKTIARTETNGAYSDARFLAAEETDPLGYEWLTSRDERVRDTHDELDGVVIQRGGAFVTGAGVMLKRPQDPECDVAGEICNCRCSFMPIYDPGRMR